MKKFLSIVALGASASGLGGCATVLNGTSQPVEFASEPTGAEIALATGLKCETPCKYSMKRGKDNVVTFTKDGYKTETVYIQSRTGGTAIGNVLAGGIIGGVVDGSNGASNHLYPDPVSIRMVPVGSKDQAVLLNKKGEVISTVAEYNAKVADDVQKGLGEQGIRPMGSPVAGSSND
jgi:hypothetical protein